MRCINLCFAYLLYVLTILQVTNIATVFLQLGIPVYSDHAIAAYFAKMRISHIFPHIMAFSKFQIFIYAFRIFIHA